MGIATDYSQLRPHRSMLRDTSRTFAFARALHHAVTSESIVLDMGTGTGILAMIAARLGAAKVIAVERTRMADIARRLVLDNRLDTTIDVIFADAAEIELDGKVDVLVSEWLGGIAIDENLLSPLLAVRDKWLKPGGTLIPAAITSWLAPTFDPYLADEFDFFTSRTYGINLDLIRDMSANELYYGRHHLGSDTVLSPAQEMWSLDLATLRAPDTDRGYAASCDFVFEADAVANGLMMWFSAVLTPNVSLSCAPDSETCWGRTVAPFTTAIALRAGDTLSVDMEVEPAGPGWVYTRWSYAVNGVSRGAGDNHKALI
ncbi:MULTISPECIES: 50S ribosomal protein L11 methyltransferase [unclassified Frankia]|uniref:50S ribosomal protein L11 methyltransferase n=1 Tax=unclassified Frankia TaxID=2632575 RepID=UPI001EF5C43F|nr:MULTISPECIES: 50S ribosomal protein L11 methyltransferase [unclassified Frankia]